MDDEWSKEDLEAIDIAPVPGETELQHTERKKKMVKQVRQVQGKLLLRTKDKGKCAAKRVDSKAKS